MPSELERIAVIEAKMDGLHETTERLRNHIGDLLDFKSGFEGGLKTLKWMIGFIGLTNIVLIVKIFISK